LLGKPLISAILVLSAARRDVDRSGLAEQSRIGLEAGVLQLL
jgi:hypothetical protein